MEIISIGIWRAAKEMNMRTLRSTSKRRSTPTQIALAAVMSATFVVSLFRLNASTKETIRLAEGAAGKVSSIHITASAATASYNTTLLRNTRTGN
jgi:hypothetical protein